MYLFGGRTMKKFKKIILAVISVFLLQVFSPIASVSASQEGVDSSQSIDNTVPYRDRDILGLGGGIGLGRAGSAAVGAATVYIGSKIYRNGGVVQKTQLKEKDRKKFPKKDLKDENHLDLDKFTKKVKGKQAWQNPKTGSVIERDNSRTNGHGGSYWKYKRSPEAHDRLATATKEGKLLRK